MGTRKVSWPRILPITWSQKKITKWKPQIIPHADLDARLDTPRWVNAVSDALKIHPDMVYLIAGTSGRPVRPLNPQALAEAQKDYTNRIKHSGFKAAQVVALRLVLYNCATAQLADVNTKLKALGRSPIVGATRVNIFSPLFKRLLRRVDSAFR